MEIKNLKGQVTISRRSNDMVYVSIRDEASKTDFVEVELSLEKYALVLTGLSQVSGEMEVYDLDRVGKTKVRVPRTKTIPRIEGDRKAYCVWLKEHAQEPGWILDAGLSSQESIFHHHSEGTVTLNYAVYKYVDPNFSQEAEDARADVAFEKWCGKNHITVEDAMSEAYVIFMAGWEAQKL